MKPTIALIYGGAGAERGVSIESAKHLLELIDRDRFSVAEVLIEKDGGWRLMGDTPTPTFPVRLKDRKGLFSDGEIIPIDTAFPLLHGDFGEDGRIQGALETAGIPFVGARTVTGAVCSDKIYTKAVAQSLGIPVAKWVEIPSDTDLSRATDEAEKKLGYPMFVKPCDLGSSISASPAEDRSSLASAISGAKRASRGRILIEEYLTDKREIELGYFAVGGRSLLTRGGEVFSESFYSYERKYESDTPTSPCAELSEEQAEELSGYGERLISALGLRHLGRLDFFVSRGRIIFNEINTMPGFTRSSLYPRMLEQAGISPRTAVNLMIEDAMREGAL